MPKFEPDQELRDALTDPLEFTLAGEDIAIEKVPPELLTLVTKNMDGMDGKQTLQFMDKVFGALLGQDRYKPIREAVDLRELKAVFTWLQEQIWRTKQEGPEKNSEGTPGE